MMFRMMCVTGIVCQLFGCSPIKNQNARLSEATFSKANQSNSSSPIQQGSLVFPGPAYFGSCQASYPKIIELKELYGASVGRPNVSLDEHEGYSIWEVQGFFNDTIRDLSDELRERREDGEEPTKVCSFLDDSVAENTEFMLASYFPGRNKSEVLAGSLGSGKSDELERRLVRPEEKAFLGCSNAFLKTNDYIEAMQIKLAHTNNDPFEEQLKVHDAFRTNFAASHGIDELNCELWAEMITQDLVD